MTGNFGDQFTSVLFYHQKDLVETSFELLNGCDWRYAPTSRGGYITETVQVEFTVAPRQLTVLIDKKTAIGICEQFIASDGFACLSLSDGFSV